MNYGPPGDAAKQKLVDSLVASGGGLVSYELGAPGKEIALAAGAHLAARTGTSLTVIDLSAVLPQLRATAAELHLDSDCRFMSVGEAVRHPQRNTGGVLVVFSIDFPHLPDTREALLARAHAADRLIMASPAHIDESVLNAFPGPRFVMSDSALMPPASANTPGPQIHVQFQAAIDTSVSERFAELRERHERFVRQLKQGAPGELNRGAPGEHDTEDLEQILKAVENADPDELQRRIARIQEQHARRAANRPAPGLPLPVTRDNGQEQSTHQQQGPRGIGLT
ncbi:hypothetical protein ACFWGI_06515 [Streptomyces niveus]|uniref:hypothetical protein n=1 Tax=Streptomyces niveus TaxID=193462 RepID=UPI0036499777